MVFRLGIWLLSLGFLVACDSSTSLSAEDNSGGTSASQKNTFLSDLKVSTGSLKPFFSQFTEAYTLEVGSEVDQITITALPLYSGASLPNGSPMVQALSYGENVVSIPVLSADGSSMRTYTVTVTRLTGMNVNLNTLTLSQGVLSPSFQPEISEYTVMVSDQYVNVLGQSNDPTNVVLGNESVWVGEPKTHSVCVQSANGSLSKCYTINFLRNPNVVTFTNNISLDPQTRIPEPISPLGSVLTSFTNYSVATFVYKWGKFRVSQTGTYSFWVQSNTANGIYILEGAFNPTSTELPTNPLTDYLGFIQNGNSTTYTVALEAGVLYSWLAVFNSSTNSTGSVTITPPEGASVGFEN